MRSERPRGLFAFSLVGGLAWLAACSAVLGGIDPGMLIPDGGLEAAADAPADHPSDVPDEFLHVGDAHCDHPIDLTEGVLVNKALGQDMASCGSHSLPCQTIGYAL